MKLYLFLPQGTLDHDFDMYGADDQYEAEEYFLEDNPHLHFVLRETQQSVHGDIVTYGTKEYGQGTYVIQEYILRRGKIE